MSDRRRFVRKSGRLSKAPLGEFWSPTLTAKDPQIPTLPLETGSAGAQNLTVARFDNVNAFYSPTVTTGPVTLSPALFVNTNAFYGPTVSPGAVALLPELFTNEQTFFDATVTGGGVLPVIGASNPGGGGGGGGRKESPEVSAEIDRTLRKMLRAAKRGELVEVDDAPEPEAAPVVAKQPVRVSDAVADVGKIARALAPERAIPIYPPALPVFVQPIAAPAVVEPDYSADDDEVLMLIYG